MRYLDRDETDFLENIMGFDSGFMGRLLEFVKDHYEVSDVFADDAIMEYAKDKIDRHYEVGDVYGENDLDDWAAKHGYVKEDS